MDRSSSDNPGTSAKPRSIQPLVWIVLICLTPVALALLAYYLPAVGLRPNESSNYGTLVSPQRPVEDISELSLTTLDGEPFDMKSLAGKWVLISADQGACPESCVEKLFILRNSHASQGKHVERLARVWFVTDDAPISQTIVDAYIGTVIVRADPVELAKYLTPGVSAGQTQAALAAPMWVMDPLGNLMLEFPADADPVLVRKDISKLIRHSRIG